MIWHQLQSRIKNLMPPEVDRIVLYKLRNLKSGDTILRERLDRRAVEQETKY
jgi:hypothetical protein